MINVKTLPEILPFIKLAKADGRVIVTTNGVYDLLHIGHIHSLGFASLQGDVLIVLVNSDQSVRLNNKGVGRPFMIAEERAALVSVISCVTACVIFNEKTPVNALSKIKPNVHVKGGDYKNNKYIPEKRTVINNGGKIMFSQTIIGRSTTKLVEKIANAHAVEQKSKKIEMY